MRRSVLASTTAALVALVGLAAARPPGDLPRRGFTGAEFRSPSPQRPFAEITRVVPGSPAALAGLRPGVRIVRVDAHALDSPKTLDRFVTRRRAGERLVFDTDTGTHIPVTLIDYPRERFDSAVVSYDSVVSTYGDRLRTIVTRPRGGGRVPVVFVVGWLSCDSVEYPFGDTDGFGQLPHYLAERSGYATVRMDKPGVGDSEGPACGDVDFDRELAGYRAAFAALRTYDLIDPSAIVVLGLSNGGGVAPLVAHGAVRAYVSISGWGRTWYEHMLDVERRRLTGGTAQPAEVNREMKVFAQFYDLFLRARLTPGQVLERHPDWRPLWYDAPDGQYGRPAAFYQQLEDLNLGEAWQRVRVPVLVVHGADDPIMNTADAQAIADAVNKSTPGLAQSVEIAGADHLLMRGKEVATDVAPMVVQWLRARLTAAR